jgi:TPR repeat protein
MLVLGFMLGTYRESIKQFVFDFAQTLGFSKEGPHIDAAYTAYQDEKYETAKLLAAPLAAAGDARAQSLLGLIYYRGRGVAQDHSEAVKWFLSAAEQGDMAAQFYLGVMFSKGEGVPQDFSEGAKWYLLAADRGDAAAQYNLGIAYATGDGGEPDNFNAHFWLNLAAARFSPSDPRRNAAIAGRDLVASKMTADQIAEAQKRAREWKPK